MSAGAYGIEEVPRSTPGALICGTCGKAWTQDITPAGRCPWEAEHREPRTDAELLGTVVTVTNPTVGSSWTGVAVAIAYDPSILLEDPATGQRFSLPLAWVER